MFPPPPSDQEIYDGVDDTDAVSRYVFISFKYLCLNVGFYFLKI